MQFIREQIFGPGDTAPLTEPHLHWIPGAGGCGPAARPGRSWSAGPPASEARPPLAPTPLGRRLLPSAHAATTRLEPPSRGGLPEDRSPASPRPELAPQPALLELFRGAGPLVVSRVADQGSVPGLTEGAVLGVGGPTKDAF